MQRRNTCEAVLNELLHSLLGLTETDLEVYRVLLREYERNCQPLSVNEIARVMNKSRSSVERSILKLLSAGLVSRRVALLASGGYTYVYYPKPLREVKEMLMERLRDFYTKAKEIIESLDQFIQIDLDLVAETSSQARQIS